MAGWVRRARRWLASAGVAGLLGVSLVVSAGPAQAAYVVPTSTGLIQGAQTTTDPAKDEWNCGGFFVLSCTNPGLRMNDDFDRWMDMHDGSSSGSWGPVPPSGPGSGPGNALSKVIMQPFVVSGNSWSVEFSNTGTGMYDAFSLAVDIWQVCGTAQGMSTIKVEATWTISPGGVWAKTGACGPGTEIVSLIGAPRPGATGQWREPANYTTYTNVDLRGSLQSAVKYSSTVDCWTDSGTPADFTDDVLTQTVRVEYQGVKDGFVYPSCPKFSDRQVLPGKVVVEFQYPGQTQWSPLIQRPKPAELSSCFVDGCKLEVRYKGSSCQVGSVPCNDWTASRLTDPSAYACWWGAEQRPISQCSVLELAYRPVAVKMTRPNTDGDPTTGDGRGSTGGGGGSAGGGAGTPDSIPGGDSDGCYPTGWSAFNPIEWIVRPFKCLLIPDPAVLAEVGERIGGAFSQASPAQWLGAVGDIFSSVEVAEGSCQGPAIHFPAMWGGGSGTTFYPIDACSGDRQLWAGRIKLGISVLAVGGGAFACVSMLAGALGYQIGRGGSS